MPVTRHSFEDHSGTVSFTSDRPPTGSLSPRAFGPVKPNAPGTPLVITLIDGSTVSIVATGEDEFAVDYTDERGRTTTGGSDLVRSIMHGNVGVRWDR